MSHIFISYSKHNSAYTYKLADYLQAQGFNIWIDRIGIEYGVGWWDAIVDGLDGCGAFIVVMTPESRASDWVQRELFIALQEKKPVFPLLLTGDNWKVFVLTQYADVRDGSLPDDEFLKRLSQCVTQHPVGRDKSTITSEQQTIEAAALTDSFDVDSAIADFNRAFRAQNWSEALNILGRIRASGADPTPFDPDDSEKRVQAVIELEKNKREQTQYTAERDKQYAQIVAMQHHDDAHQVWARLQKFWQTFPHYDPQYIARKVRAQLDRPRSSSVLPAPFDWIALVGEGYSIAKYPITNAQFDLFIAAGGYRQQKWWTQAGWKARSDGWRYDGDWKPSGRAWTEPRCWRDDGWMAAEQPVVGVSWYEAVAFCLWLSDVTGETITLPTDAQWQFAAQGDDGRAYPWGDVWDCARCNNSVRPCVSEVTTPIQHYASSGKSPFGAVDMAGNVYEWCLTDYKSGANLLDGAHVRVLRGGSWDDLDARFYRCDFRFWGYPYYRNSTFGFRICRV